MKKRTTQLQVKILKFAAFLLVFASSSLFAQQQLAAWNPAGLSGYGPSPWAAATTNGSMTVGGWERGSGVGTSGVAAGSAWGGSAWNGGANDGVTFTVTSNPGSIVSYSVFNLFYRRSATGPGTGTFDFTIGNAGTTYTTIAPFTFATGNTGFQHAPIDLSTTTALQNVPPGTVIKFRILPTGATQPAGTWYIYGVGANLVGSFNSFGLSIVPSAPIGCNGQSNGALTASVNGGTPPFTYTWMPGNITTSVMSGLGAGVYTCYVHGSVPTETTFATYSLTAPALVSASVVSQGSVTCFGGSNGSVTVSGTGGTAPYSYVWAPSGATNPILTNIQAGSYVVNVTDSHTCTGTQTISITQAIASLSTSSSSSLICNGSTVTLNATGPNTYTWTSGVTNGIPFSPSVTTIYTVGATNSTGGCTESNTITVNVNPSPTVTATSDFSAVCMGSPVVLTAGGANSFVWSSGIADGVAFIPTATADYTVTGTDNNNCTGTTVITITVNALPTLSASSSKTLTCKGKTATLTATGADTYSWSANVTGSLVTVSPTVTTVYTLTGTDANGCSNTAVITQSVSNCLGIENNTKEQVQLLVFPNPNTGSFTLKNASDIDLLIINSLGQIIQSVKLNDTNNRELKIDNLSSGVYFITSATAGHTVQQKVIVTK